MSLNSILSNPRSLIKAIVKNNFQDVTIGLQIETGVNNPTQTEAVDALYQMYQNEPHTFMEVVDVRWITGKKPEIDQFVIDNAGQGNALIKAIENYEQKEEVSIEKAAKPELSFFSEVNSQIAAAFFFFLIIPFIISK